MAMELEDDFLSYRKCQLADIVGVGYLLLNRSFIDRNLLFFIIFNLI